MPSPSPARDPRRFRCDLRCASFIVFLLVCAIVAFRPAFRSAWHNAGAPQPLHVVRTGEGLPVLLLHGLSGSHEYFDFLTPELARQYRVIAPDLLGFGRSPWPDSAYTLDDHLDALEGVLPEEPFAIVGHSMGSLLGLELARRMPERVTLVIALAPPSLPDRDALRAALRKESRVESLMALDRFWAPLVCHLHEVLGGASFHLYRPFIDPAVPDAVVRAATQHRWASYDGSLRHVVLKSQALHLLPGMAVPVTLMVGRDDLYSDNTTLLKLRPDTKVLEGGHNFPWQAPTLTREAVLEALAPAETGASR